MFNLMGLSIYAAHWNCFLMVIWNISDIQQNILNIKCCKKSLSNHSVAGLRYIYAQTQICRNLATSLSLAQYLVGGLQFGKTNCVELGTLPRNVSQPRWQPSNILWDIFYDCSLLVVEAIEVICNFLSSHKLG